MSKIVLDASAILAILLDETPLQDAGFSPKDAVMSAVNLAEVYTRIIDLQSATSELLAQIPVMVPEIIPFSPTHAMRAAQLRPVTRPLGLSLGDRACLALAMELDADVYTADRAWKDLNLPCRVHLVR